MDIVIRKISQKDKVEFLDMSKAFYSSEAVLHNINNSFHERAFDELMRSETYLNCYFIEIENSVVGYALLNKTYSREAGGLVVWVEELYIKPLYQGKGIGGSFFHWLEANVPARRYRLEIEPENHRAAALYKRKGYQPLPYVQMVRDIK